MSISHAHAVARHGELIFAWLLKPHPLDEVKPDTPRLRFQKLKAGQSAADNAQRICRNRINSALGRRNMELVPVHSSAAVVAGSIDLVTILRLVAKIEPD